MIVRPWAIFKADFPDDMIEDEHDIVQFGGLGVAEAIGEILTQMGCLVSDPIYGELHGWGLAIQVRSRDLWCQITDGGDQEVRLYIEALSWLDKILRRCNPAYIETLEKLHAALTSDPRFDQIQWFALDHKGCMGDEACKEPVTPS